MKNEYDLADGMNEIVVTEDGQYPNDIPIDFLKDKSDLLNNFGIGQEVNVSVNIRGSEYNGKNYVSLNGWKIEATDAVNQAPTFEPVNEQEMEEQIVGAIKSNRKFLKMVYNLYCSLKYDL